MSDQQNPQGMNRVPGMVPGMVPAGMKPGGSSMPPYGAQPEYVGEEYGDSGTGAISRGPVMVVAVLVIIGGLFLGYNSGKAWSNRGQLNVSLRDSMVVQYEVDKAAKLFDELDAVVSAAIQRAGKNEYDAEHIEFLGNNLKENPLKAEIFTERSYKSFGRDAVMRLSGYYVKWLGLYDMMKRHQEKTKGDEEALKGFKGKYEKILASQYGVIFKREKSGFLGSVGYLGAAEEKGDSTRYPVKGSGEGSGEMYTLYVPPAEGDNGVLTKTPGDWVVEVAPEAKGGMLASGVNGEFGAYYRRLSEIAMQMKSMRDEQTGLMRRLAVLASQDPASLASPDPEREFEAYMAQNGKKGQ